MLVPEPLFISSRLLAAYTFEDGSTLHVSPDGEYVLEDADGDVLAEGDDLRPSPMTRDALDLAAAMASFIRHDAELYEFSSAGWWGQRYPDSATDPEEEAWIFGPIVGKWAYEHGDELADLACMDEEREEH